MNDNEKKLQQLKATSWQGQKAYYDLSARQDYSVSIVADHSVSPAKFKPNPKIPGGYLAHPTTIAAMKKDIFVADNNFSEFEEWVDCKSCQTKLDMQFWHFCPHCESSF